MSTPRVIKPDTLHERVSGLEASLAGLQHEMVALQESVTDGFRDLKKSADDSSRTNWTVVLGGIVVLMAVYAAAVQPIVKDLTRQESQAGVLADAVLKQNQALNDQRVEGAIARATVESLVTSVQNFRDTGSPALVPQIAAIKEKLATIEAQGSPITDRRLSVLEYRINQLDHGGPAPITRK